jgi:hypothetical protein
LIDAGWGRQGVENRRQKRSRYSNAMCNFLEVLINSALPTLREASYIPNPSPKPGRREPEMPQAPSSPKVGRGGLGR